MKSFERYHCRNFLYTAVRIRVSFHLERILNNAITHEIYDSATRLSQVYKVSAPDGGVCLG